MEYVIQNDELAVRVSDRGAELRSILCRADGRECLWQGLPQIWPDRAPNLFPYIGRLTGGAYTYGGERYSLPIHGFAPTADFTVVRQSPDSIALELTDSAATRAVYPFPFRLEIGYALEGNALRTRYRVENRGDGPMFFGLGGHPGIRVPLDDATEFEDWRVRFPQAAEPVRVGFTPDCFVSGEETPFPLADGTDLPLRHDLFDDDAIVLRGAGDVVELVCPASPHSVRMDFGGFPYLGLWHWPKTDAPYVCLEPWSSLPARAGVTEDLSAQPGLIRLEAGERAERMWTIRIE